MTHIGKEVNGLRKMEGDVGRMAKQLVKTWKQLLVDRGREGGKGEGREREGGRGKEERGGEGKAKGKHKEREERREREQKRDSPCVPRGIPDSPATSLLATPTSSARGCRLLGYCNDGIIMMTLFFCPL